MRMLARLAKQSVRALPLVIFALSAFAYAQPKEQTLELSKCPREKGKWTIFGAQCGTFTVAENPAKTDGRQLALNVLRIPSIKESDKAPIFFISGGPGQGSTELAQMMRANFDELLTERDFVFVDQRGTGKSHPLDCDSDMMENVDKPSKEAAQIQLQKLKECVAKLDADYTYYSTPYAVKDLEAVRQALGYSKINLWGISYGTRVVLEYNRAFPQSIARSVLDGVAPVSIELPVHGNEDASRSLEKVFTACAQSAPCAERFGDLQARWTALLQDLRKNPRMIRLQHPRTEESFDAYLDDVNVSGQVRMSLYNREVSSMLPLAIDKAVNGDFSILASIILVGFEQTQESLSEVMHLAVLCNEDQQLAKFSQAQPLREQVELLHAADLKDFTMMCDIFPRFDIDPDYFSAFKSDVPALLLSGEFDPVTPPLWAERAKQHFNHAQHIVAPGGHHGISTLGCMSSLITDFYNGEALPLDASCAEDIQAKPFFIDNAGPALEVATPSPEDEKEPTQAEQEESAQ